jgi:hypothetical protein
MKRRLNNSGMIRKKQTNITKTLIKLCFFVAEVFICGIIEKMSVYDVAERVIIIGVGYVP